MSKEHSTTKSFGYAFSGLKLAIQNEPNFRTHLFFATLAILASILLRVSFVEFAIVLISISFVLILELLNTTLEALVDLVSPQIAEKAKIAKDVAAASVLVSAIMSVVIGIVVFAPKIIKLMQ